jgi:hypothetical protein
MDVKRLITQFTYRIEQKPGGGFVAHSSNPGAPPLEAPTRSELQQKIQDNINSVLKQEFPGLQLPDNKRVSFHLERQADGNFAFHSSDPNAQSTTAPHEEVESHFAEKMFSLFGKQILSHLPPEMASQLPPELAQQIGSGNIKVFVEKRVTTLRKPEVGAVAQESSAASTPDMATSSAGPINPADNSPITPEASSTGTVFRFLIAALIVIAAMYAYFHFRH